MPDLCHCRGMQTSHFAPRQFLPETIDLTDTAQLAPVFDKLDAQLDAGGFGGRPRGVAAQPQRSLRRAGRVVLARLHRDDLPDRRRGEGKGLHAHRRGGRSVAQAAPVRADAEAGAVAAVSRKLPAVLRGLSPQRRDAGENLPRGKRRARNAGREARRSSTRKSAAR